MPALVAHLPGKHDQSTHGKGGAGPLTGDDAVAAVAYTPSNDQIRTALDEYGGEGPDSYEGINDALRGGGTFGREMTPSRQTGVDNIDAAMRETPGAPQDLLVYRQARGPDAFGGTNDDWFGPKGRGDMTGLTWRDKGFVSTGAGTQWAQSEQVTMHIRVPAGTKALSYTRPDGGGLDKDEILLDRGLTFRVVADRGYRRMGFDGEPDPFSGRDLDVEVVPT